MYVVLIIVYIFMFTVLTAQEVKGSRLKAKG